MKIGIVGSRNFTNGSKVKSKILELISTKLNLQAKDISIISGNAKGIDTMARELANSYKIDLTEYLPKWEDFDQEGILLILFSGES